MNGSNNGNFSLSYNSKRLTITLPTSLTISKRKAPDFHALMPAFCKKANHAHIIASLMYFSVETQFFLPIYLLAIKDSGSYHHHFTIGHLLVKVFSSISFLKISNFFLENWNSYCSSVKLPDGLQGYSKAH